MAAESSRRAAVAGAQPRRAPVSARPLGEIDCPIRPFSGSASASSEAARLIPTSRKRAPRARPLASSPGEATTGQQQAAETGRGRVSVVGADHARSRTSLALGPSPTCTGTPSNRIHCLAGLLIGRTWD